MDHQRPDEPAVRRPDAPPRRRTGQRLLAAAAAAVLGFGGAAAIDHLALAAPALTEADGWGPGDGLTRFVLTGEDGPVSQVTLDAVAAVEGVVNVQSFHDGSGFVATEGLAPEVLAAVPGIASVELSPSVPVLSSADPYYDLYGWNLDNTGANAYQQTAVPGIDIDAPIGWAAGTGRGMVVAVTDTGYDSDHPDLAGALWTNPDEPCGSVDHDGNGKIGDCHGWNFETNSADVDNGPGGSHGTSVSGVVAARAGNGVGTIGVAPDIQVMPLVIGTGGSVDVNLAAQAIRYAVDHGAHVINASWGGAFTGTALTNLKSAVAYAAAHDVLVVAAAGNDALNRDVDLFYPASLPDSNIITVGSHTAADTVSESSAHGASSVDLFAPGNKVAVVWNDGSYRVSSGTSIAAPHVAAAIALYKARTPSATATQLKAAVLDDVALSSAYAGRSVTGGRLSLAELGASAEDVRYSFTGMRAEPGTVTPQVFVDGSTPEGSYSVRFGLGMEHQGEVMAVAGHQVALGNVATVTNDAGEVTFPLGTRTSAGPQVLSPSTELGAGRYVLTAQLSVDGVPVGRRYAAPLLVATAAATPTSAAPTSAAPTSAAPTSRAPSGGSTAPTASPTSGSTVAPSPGTTAAPTSSGPGGSGGTAPTSSAATPTAGGPTGTAPAPTTPRVTSSPTASATATPTAGGGSGGATPTGSSSASSTPTGTASPTRSSTAPAPGSTPTSSPSPTAPGGGITYPPTGAFGLTSISPSQVGTDGGTAVTITGTAIPLDAQVLVGGSRPATVTSVSATRLVFRAPALAVGTYDVTVFNGTSTQSATLTDGLTAVAGGSGGSGGATPTSTGATPTTTAGQAPGVARPTEVAGPHGLRLVRSPLLASLAPRIWQVNCSSACSGLAV
ncbi:S8 family serine peptidase [Modestobacter sp. SYSU DS0657]